MAEYKFIYTRHPKVGDFLIITGALVFAAFFAIFALRSIQDSLFRSAPTSDACIFLALALLSCGAVVTLGQGMWRRIKAYRNSEPALIIDDRGITMPSWNGRPTTISWSVVTGVCVTKMDRVDVLIVEFARGSGRLPIDDLNTTSEAILRAAQECSGRTF